MMTVFPSITLSSIQPICINQDNGYHSARWSELSVSLHMSYKR